MAEAWVCLDERLRPVLQGATAERLCTGATWSEGPAWVEQDQSLLWSDIPNNRMLRWSAADGMSVWAENVEYTNGHFIDHDGSLLHCSHGLRGIYRTPLRNGRLHGSTPMERVVDRFNGKRLNSPNDLVVKSDRTIWFTDPPYGILSDREGHQAESEIGRNHVFRFDPRTDSLESVCDAMDEPNGLAFSPDERLLYVSDTSAALRPQGQGHHHILVFDVIKGERLANRRVFAEIEPGLPDGFRVDQQGWIYTSSEDSVQVYHPEGTLLGKLWIPEKVGNLTFGGPGGNQLFITASTSLYRFTLNTQGLARP